MHSRGIRPALLLFLTAAAGAMTRLWLFGAVAVDERRAASSDGRTKFERRVGSDSRLWAFSEDPRQADISSLHSSSQEGTTVIAPKEEVMSREQLLEKAASVHSQSLEELLERGMSLGAMAKVAVDSERRRVFEEVTKFAKQALEACQADETAEQCLKAKAESEQHSLKNMPNSNIGEYTLKAIKNKSDQNESNQGKAKGPLPSSRSRTTSTDALHDKAFVQVRSIGAIWDTLFGGAGAGNAENFEGGNQGSYFNFMYPSDNDFPWACMCDEGQYKQWELGQVSYVSCRNQVDLSAQNTVPMCNPKNHKMNAASTAAPTYLLAASASVLALFANV